MVAVFGVVRGVCLVDDEFEEDWLLDSSKFFTFFEYLEVFEVFEFFELLGAIDVIPSSVNIERC